MFTEVVEGLVGMADADLHDRIGELELQRRRVEAELAAAIAVADARQLHQADAHRSMKGYLKASCNWSNHEVSRWRSVAKAVDANPRIGDEWMSGHVGSPQVALLAKTHGNRRVRDALPTVLPTLLTHAEELPFDDFRTVVEHFVARADEDGAHDARDDAIEHRRARVVDVGGTLDVSMFGGDSITTAEMIAIHRRFCDVEFEADLAARRDLHGDDAPNHDLPRTAAQRSYDAMVAIFRAANTAGTDTVTKPADTVVNIVIDAATFARMQAASGLAPTTVDGQFVDPFTGLAAPRDLLDDLIGAGERLVDIRCETDSGVAVHPHDVLRATLAGHVRRVVVDSAGRVIDHGRKQRLYTGAAREAAKLLIKRCVHAGCDLPADICHVDHDTEWSALGATDQINSRILCPGHNLDRNTKRTRQRRATNGRSYTIRADGTIILPVGARPPDFVDEPDPDDPTPWVDPDSPDEIERLRHLACQRLRTATNPDAA